jgi:translation initiation factor 2 alpha subunit (eIF-2alpha)
MNMEEGDLVLCKVREVSNTITSVELPDGKQGTIVSSEIAPGRIKFMRQYVVPNKQIVCKVLSTSGDNVHLSLRRVTSKEKKEVMQSFKQEQATKVAFKQILGEGEIKVSEKILGEFDTLAKFIDAARDDEKLIDKYIPKAKQDQIKKVAEKKKKSSELKQNIKIKCLEDDGVKKIKEIFDLDDKNISVNYISAGQFKLKLVVEDFKQGKKRMSEIIEELEKRAKKHKCEFFASEEK